ncbi:trehalose-phosphatase [Sphingomonas sp. CJ20]
MRRGSPISTQPITALATPPVALLDGASLFLDFDGTLVDLIDRPDQVTADPQLRELLSGLHARLGGRLAVISGRSLAQLDAMLGPIAHEIGLAGSHGTEHRWRGLMAQPDRPAALDLATGRFHGFAARNAGVLVEEKSYGVALHYRARPQAEPDALHLARELAGDHDLLVQEGKMMVELRVPGGDKGTAIARMMEHAPMAGTRPVFLGDDWTDEPGFAAVEKLGGAGVLVGAERATAAHYHLGNPAAVRAWLAEACA